MFTHSVDRLLNMVFNSSNAAKQRCQVDRHQTDGSLKTKRDIQGSARSPPPPLAQVMPQTWSEVAKNEPSLYLAGRVASAEVKGFEPEMDAKKGSQSRGN